MTDFAAASRHLARRDPVVAGLVQRFGPCELPPRRASACASLTRTIISQQLGTGAARTIHGRFQAACGGRVTPDAVLSLPEATARAAGLSGAKWSAIQAVAEALRSGALSPRRLARLDDEAARAELTAIRGLGPWSADIYLLFHLRRPDVWPVGDLGVRKGYALAWGLDETPTARELETLGERLAPHRSVVAWYCWRVLDAPPA